MYKLLVLCKFWVGIEFFLQEILHSFHIMIGGRLYGLDTLCVLQGEVIKNLV